MTTASIAFPECDEPTVSRDVLESLPQSLYRALPWPTHTIDSCVKIVAEAQRTNNPRRVRAWIDFERATPSGNEILGCLDSVLHQLTLPGEAFADRVKFANKLRQDAVDYMRSSGALAKADTQIDSTASILADGLMSALRLHDADLADHSEVVADLARRLAVAAGLDDMAIARVTLAARLHDIGKMRVSRSVFTKPLPLTAAEREEVRAYPGYGADTLASLPALADIAPIVRAHAEWVDGNGYPEALTRNEIPVESRIIAIADAFHTMTISRPHRKARTTNESIEKLIASRGTQFDSDLVDAFASMLGYRGRVARYA